MALKQFVVNLLAVGAVFVNYGSIKAMDIVNDKEEILMYWSSGYFGKEIPRPLGGTEENRDFFVEKISSFLKNSVYSVTMITSKNDWDFFKNEKFSGLLLNPIFIEDMIHVLINENMPKIENSYACQVIEIFLKSIKTKEYEIVSNKFSQKNKESIKSLQEKMEFLNYMPKNHLICPNFKDLNDTQILNNYIAFWIAQGLYGNPAMSSDFVRYFYALTCSRDKPYVYIDIDTFLEIERNDKISFSSYLDAHINYVNSLDAQSCYYHYSGEIDFIVKRKKISDDDFIEICECLFLEYFLSEKITFIYFFSTTSWFFDNCQECFFDNRMKFIVDSLTSPLMIGNKSESENVVNLIYNIYFNEEDYNTSLTPIFAKFQLFSAIGNYAYVPLKEIFPNNLISNRKSEWSSSYLPCSKGKHQWWDKAYEVFNKNIVKREVIAQEDMQILFYEYLDHD